MGFFEKPGGLDGKNKNSDDKKKIKKIVSGAMAAGSIFLATEAEAGSSTGKYVVDKDVVGQEEYRIPGVVDENSIPGVVEADKVAGAVKDDGKIYREEEIVPKEDTRPRRINLQNMHPGGKIEIDGKKYDIEK